MTTVAAQSLVRRAASTTTTNDDSFATLKRWLASPDRIDDGKWHRVRFRLALAEGGSTERRWKVRLTVDGLNPRFARVSWGEGSARQQEMLMGAEVRSLLHGYTDVRRSFAGECGERLSRNWVLENIENLHFSPPRRLRQGRVRWAHAAAPTTDLRPLCSRAAVATQGGDAGLHGYLPQLALRRQPL